MKERKKFMSDIPNREEEFLYAEDFERVEKELAIHFNKEDSEPMRDGNDYIRGPKTKKEFIRRLQTNVFSVQCLINA
jgi:hypothetical protein